MRQISGEVYAAAQASTCCDVTGEESPEGRRGGNQDNLRDEKHVRACLSKTNGLIDRPRARRFFFRGLNAGGMSARI